MTRVQIGHALTAVPVVTVRVRTREGWLAFDALPDNARVMAEALLNAADKADRREGF
jgi:hypothetical protein